MRLIDADELRERVEAFSEQEARHFHWYAALSKALEVLDAAPTVDVPQPLTRDGVLVEVARIEATGDTAVVEVLWPFLGAWSEAEHDEVKCWGNPDVPRWNVRVRVVPAETEWVPLTRLVGRTIKGEGVDVVCPPTYADSTRTWMWWNGVKWRPFPDGTLNVDDATVAVRPEAAT